VEVARRQDGELHRLSVLGCCQWVTLAIRLNRVSNCRLQCASRVDHPWHDTADSASMPAREAVR
jgi:hypothetical protein